MTNYNVETTVAGEIAIRDAIERHYGATATKDQISSVLESLGDGGEIEVKEEDDEIDVADLVITDTVPKNTTYVAGSIKGKGADDRAVPDLAWNVGTLKQGKSVTVSFRSTIDPGVPAGTRIRNTARVDGFGIDPYTEQVTGDGVDGEGGALARTTGGGYATFWAAGGMGAAGLLLLGLWTAIRRRQRGPAS